MHPLELETKHVRSFDGTDIRYQVSGNRGPWMLLVNGLASRMRAWRMVIDYLGGSYRFLSWDYRGLYDPAQPEVAAGLSRVGVHARDLQAVLAAEGVDQAVWTSWSSGSQVALEAMRQPQSSSPSHLIMLNPSFGTTLSNGPLSPVAKRIRPYLFDLLQGDHPWVSALTRRASRWPETGTWLARLRVVAPTVDQEMLAEMATSFAALSLQALVRNVRDLLEHDTAALLSTLKVPTLVVAGGRDRLVPAEVTERAVGMMRGVETLWIRTATHYAPLEFPELINLRIEKFLREHG